MGQKRGKGHGFDVLVKTGTCCTSTRGTFAPENNASQSYVTLRTCLFELLGVSSGNELHKHTLPKLLWSLELY